MSSRIVRGILTGVAALGLVCASVAAAPAASAAPIIDESQWVKGEPVVNNTPLICIGTPPFQTCVPYQLLFAKVNYRGPIGNEGAVPRVGDRFYIHAYAGVIFPFSVNDSYKLSLLLPDGLKVDIRSDTDVQCSITDTSFTVVRQIFSNECQDPVRVGVYEEFPAVALSEGEVINFFVPVVATRTFNQGPSDTIGLLADPITNPRGALPDPVYATNTKLVVDPAPATAPGGPGTPGSGTPGSGTPGSGIPGSGTPGTGPQNPTATLALPAKIRGAKRLKSTTPKICKISGKGKKAKVVRVKAGKCKLVGTKKGKRVKVTLRLR